MRSRKRYHVISGSTSASGYALRHNGRCKPDHIYGPTNRQLDGKHYAVLSLLIRRNFPEEDSNEAASDRRFGYELGRE